MPSRSQLCSDDTAKAFEREACPNANPSGVVAEPDPDKPSRGTAAQRELTERAKHYIASYPNERIGLSEISAALQVTGPYLTAVFRQVEGVPLYRYLLRRRLKRALELLPQHENLARLATDLGFASHSHFTTAFARAFGCVPSAFRTRARAVCRTLRLRKSPH